jgi:hypothetical protein
MEQASETFDETISIQSTGTVTIASDTFETAIFTV